MRAPRGPVLVNRSFLKQRITGQQRYAGEIAQRVLASSGFESIAPDGWWGASALRVWAWLQFVLPARARNSVLLSLTSRAPAFHRHQVLVVHDLFVITNPEWFSRKFILSHAPLLKIQARRAAAIVAVSEPVARQVETMFNREVVVAPNAPSAAFANRGDPADDSAVLAARGLSKGSYLLAVGSKDPRKNLPALARAYGMLDEGRRMATPLVVVGAGSAVFRDEDIEWPIGTVDAGYVTDDELRVLYAGSAAVVFVSLAEGFGLPLVEAAAAGATNLVISDIPVFRWICGEGAIYVDPHSVEGIAAGLRAVLAAPVALSLDPGRFTWDDSARIVRETCKSINGGTP